MGILALFFGGIAGMVILHFWQRSRRLDKDRDQHHLASMLISVAAGRDEVSRADLLAFLAHRKYRRAEMAYRLNHAVALARTAVTGDLYDRVVALVRGINAPS